MKYDPEGDQEFQLDLLLNDGLDIEDNFRKPVELGKDTQFNQVAYEWPSADGAGVLHSDGEGNLSWISYVDLKTLMGL